MQYHEAQEQHAAAHPLQVQRWSESTERWVLVSECKSQRDADRSLSMARVTMPNVELRIAPATDEATEQRRSEATRAFAAKVNRYRPGSILHSDGTEVR